MIKVSFLLVYFGLIMLIFLYLDYRNLDFAHKVEGLCKESSFIHKHVKEILYND